MRCSHEDDRTISRNVERAPWSDFSEEYLCNTPPEEQSSVIGNLRIFVRARHGGGESVGVLQAQVSACEVMAKHAQSTPICLGRYMVT
jgi:hypothetical protein